MKIDWAKMEEALPAFICMTLIPFTFSITDGIAAGFIVYALVRLVRRSIKKEDVAPTIIAVAFLIYYVVRA